jgi:catechol 2,3-dioxygenase-like lactoylglutathione lyase family enzyme
MTEAIPVAGVNEVVLETIDLESAERFYTEVLGSPVNRTVGRTAMGRPGAVWVLGGATRVGLWKPALGISRARPGVHVGSPKALSPDVYGVAST